jgi:ribonuclease HII
LPSFELELDIQRGGFLPVAGIDEAGRGPLAGPVVAAAVVLPQELPAVSSHLLPDWLQIVDDSKVLRPAARRQALEHIRENAVAMAVGMASHVEIDRVGIAEATRRAMVRAVVRLPSRPAYLLVDYVKLPRCGVPFLSMAHGDALSYSVAAASIVAKEARDRMMEEAEANYPGYGFGRHKGYATAEHLRSLADKGPCPIHRRSFRPMALDPEANGPLPAQLAMWPGGGA